MQKQNEAVYAALAESREILAEAQKTAAVNGNVFFYCLIAVIFD